MLVVGDVMLDRYWFGDVERISPEAPVPVVKIARTEERPGGAANVARNAAALGAQTTLLSVTGADEAGAALERLLAADRVRTSFHRDPIAAHDREAARDRAAAAAAADRLRDGAVARGARHQARRLRPPARASADLVILSDYGKGGLAHIATMIERARAAGKPVLVDPKGDDWARYRGATVITPNRSEFRQVVGRWADGREMAAKAQALRAELDVEALLVTRSEEGMSLYTADGAEDIPAVAREVFDVSGAGDTVIATLGVLLGRGRRSRRRGAHRQRGGGRRRRQARHRGRHARRARVTRRAQPWRKRRPSTAAPNAAGRARNGRASARICERLEHAGRDDRRPGADAVPDRGRQGECACARSAASMRRDSPRFPTGLEEFDRVLGGGLVPGGVILLGGDPGIGKSTLLLQAMAAIGAAKKALYVTGEESVEQVALRAQRLGLVNAPVSLLAEVQLEAIVATIGAEAPEVVVIDSIQTAYTEALTSAPGSVAQVRECAAQLTRLAKQRSIVVIFVGHVTKEGAIAGPRVLEHIVDTVLYFEGDTHSSFRLVRAIKNRFGAANELGVFAMTERGLRGVANPSALFLSQHGESVAGLGDRRDARGLAAAAGRDPGAGRSGAGRHAEAAVGRPRSAAAVAAARRPAPARRRRDRAATTSSSTPSAACGSTSRPPTSRSCSRCIRR